MSLRVEFEGRMPKRRYVMRWDENRLGKQLGWIIQRCLIISDFLESKLVAWQHQSDDGFIFKGQKQF